MARRLILHIGDCKTGSTVIQTMLARGDCTPRRDGPARGDYAPRDARLFVPGRGVHGALARSLGEKPGLYPGRWQGMARRLAAAEWDVAILSSELFEFIPPHKVATAVRDHLADWWDSLRVIVYVRPHAGRVLSQFAENTKLGHDTGTLDDFYLKFRRAGRLKYAERLAGWRDSFGDRLIVRPFVRDLMHLGDVRHDFAAQVFGADGYDMHNSGQDDNSSLALPDLAVMRVIQRKLVEACVSVDNRVALGKQLGQMLRDMPETGAQTGPPPKLRLHQTIADDIRSRCAMDAAQMDADWIGTACFTPALDQIDASPAAADLTPETYFGPDTVRLIDTWTALTLRQATSDPDGFARSVRGVQPATGTGD